MEATETATRIRGWKAIAEFFDVSSRDTPARWAREHGMPIHYGPGDKPQVFAFTNELLEWEMRRSRKNSAIKRKKGQ